MTTQILENTFYVTLYTGAIVVALSYAKDNKGKGNLFDLFWTLSLFILIATVLASIVYMIFNGV